MGRSRVALVAEQDVTGIPERVFADARQSLGISFVPELLRAYATIPKFLEIMWTTVDPALRSGEFVRCAERLRAQAYTEAFNYLEPIPPLPIENSEIVAVLQFFNEVSARFLLLASIVLRAMESPVGSAGAGENVAPQTLAVIQFPNTKDQNAVSREVIEDYKAVRGAAIVNCWMQALARWPDFLHEYWSTLRPLATSPIYARIALELRETAFSLPDELPVVVDLTPERLSDAGVSEHEIAEAGRITNMVAIEYASMVLDVELAAIAHEQAERKISTTPLKAA